MKSNRVIIAGTIIFEKGRTVVQRVSRIIVSPLSLREAERIGEDLLCRGEDYIVLPDFSEPVCFTCFD